MGVDPWPVQHLDVLLWQPIIGLVFGDMPINNSQEPAMTTHLKVPFEILVELVEQLPPYQQHDLLHRLQERARSERRTAEEKIELLRAVQVDVAVKQESSPRREDWYDDDGR
jgi:hypothetical protein